MNIIVSISRYGQNKTNEKKKNKQKTKDLHLSLCGPMLVLEMEKKIIAITFFSDLYSLLMCEHAKIFFFLNPDNVTLKETVWRIGPMIE